MMSWTAAARVLSCIFAGPEWLPDSKVQLLQEIDPMSSWSKGLSNQQESCNDDEKVLPYRILLSGISSLLVWFPVILKHICLHFPMALLD